MTGEEFLDKLYSDLKNSDEVKHLSENVSDKNAAIKNYLDRLERVHSKVKNEHQLNMIKNLYYKKYIIKDEDIPEYMNKERVKNAQKQSMDKWLNYLLDKNSKYPMWAKYWAFQGMLKIGSYSEATGTYQKRSRKTLAPFIEVNPEILAKCIGLIINYIEKKEISESELVELVKSGNFQKMYTSFIKNNNQRCVKNNDNNSLEGIWIEYSYESYDDALEKEKNGITPEYRKLYDSLQGYNTGWCTAGDLDMAMDQICGTYMYEGGDFYVYYTIDNNGEYKIPRIAIRTGYYKDVEEIRGIADGQNIEDGLEDALIKKLKEFDLSDNQLNEFIINVNDSKKITELIKKQKNNQEFSLSDLKFLYGLDHLVVGFGWDADERIEFLLNERNNSTDIIYMIENCKTFEEKVEIIIEGINIKYLPMDYPDYFKLVFAAVSEKGHLISYIPENIPNYFEIALAAVKSSEFAIGMISPNIENYDILEKETKKKR